MRCKTHAFWILAAALLLFACSPLGETPYGLYPTAFQTVDIPPSATPQPSQTPEAPTATPAIVSEDVQAVQARLLDLGYAEVGSVDGVFTAQTDAALRHFQYLNELPITGQADDLTRPVLEGPDARPYTPLFPFPGLTLAADAATCDDHMLKDRLASLGYMEPGLSDWQTDTVGEPTQKAMADFFKANGLLQDGVMSFDDWNVLFSPGAVNAEGEGLSPVPDEAAWQTSIYAVPGQPFDLAWDGERLWVAVHDFPYGMPAVYIIDPAAPPYAAVSAVRLGGCGDYSSLVNNIASAGDRIWVLLSDPYTDAQSLQSIALRSALASAPLPIGDCSQGCLASSALGFDGKTLWASANDQAWAVNPNNGEAFLSLEIGWLASGDMVFDGKECLYLNGEAGVVAFSHRGEACPSYDYGLYRGGLAWDGTRMWSAGHGRLMSYDPQTGLSSDLTDIPGGDNALAFDGQRLWISSSRDWTVQAMDLSTGQMSKPLLLAGEPAAMLYDGARLWIANSTGTVQFIDPQDANLQLVAPLPTATFIPTSAIPPTITPFPAPGRDLYLTTPNLNGDDVLFVQNRLKALGYNIGVPDGIFTSLTDAAVRHFQQRNALAVNGLVDEKTWNALFSPSAKGP